MAVSDADVERWRSASRRVRGVLKAAFEHHAKGAKTPTKQRPATRGELEAVCTWLALEVQKLERRLEELKSKP